MELTNIQKIGATKYLSALILLAYLIAALLFIPGYFKWDATAVMGVLSLPYVCAIEKNRQSLRYLPLALCFIFLLVLAPIHTFFLLALLFSVLLLIEGCYGRVSPVLFFMLMLISPVFNSITRMIEFPVRLWLTDHVAALLNLAGQAASAAGNLIIIGKTEYSVDPACAGLNMLAVSLLICLVLIAFYQRATSSKLPWAALLSMLAVTVILNLVCNFFRILLLVVFKVMPGNPFHDLIGVGCLLIYVIAALLPGLRIIFKQYAKPVLNDVQKSSGIFINLRHGLMHLAFLLILIFAAHHMVDADSIYQPAPAPAILNNYQRTQLQGGIIKFQNKAALIYIKPTQFYAPEHDPMICWTGSGYQFKNIRTEKIKNGEIYTALLTRGSDKIYASWWFDNGDVKTINQLQWRWQSARGARQFYLVNINSSSLPELNNITRSVLNQRHLFNP